MKNKEKMCMNEMYIAIPKYLAVCVNINDNLLFR